MDSRTLSLLSAQSPPPAKPRSPIPTPLTHSPAPKTPLKKAQEQVEQELESTGKGQEQYDALQEFCTPTSVFPIFDFAYGMGGGVFGTDSSNNGAAMNVISNAFIIKSLKDTLKLNSNIII